MVSRTESGIVIAFQSIEEKNTMLNETDSTNTTKLQGDAPDVQKETDEKLNRIANEAATRAGTRQRRYDEEHGIFTK
jgi:hypothetical protein